MNVGPQLHGYDIEELIRFASKALDSKDALQGTKFLFQNLDIVKRAVPEVLEPIDPTNFKRVIDVASLAVTTDLLYWVCLAVKTIATLSSDTCGNQRAATFPTNLVIPVANCLSQLVPRYSHLAVVEDDDLFAFMNEFMSDSEAFGGGPNSPTKHIGGLLCAANSLQVGDLAAFDKYSYVTNTAFDMVIRLSDATRYETVVKEPASIFLNAIRKMIRDILKQSSTVPAEAQNLESEDKDSHIAGGDVDRFPSRSVRKEIPVNPEAALKTAMDDLECLIGLPGVKDEIKRLMSFLKIQQERRKHGLRESGQTLHFVFTGNPGTGKTTVARIVSKILCGFDLLKTTKVVECDRSDLVGGYLGQTAIKTGEKIASALDGVLFIDEAYALASDSQAQGDTYGDEAINTLLKRMEDHRDRLVVIAAGYPKPMETFLRANPGLESRFTRFIRFEDYDVPDLCHIFEKFCREAEYTLTPSCRAYACLLFTLAYLQRDERFGNARFVRNIFEQAISRQSQRLSALPDAQIDKQALITLEAPDINFDSISDLDIQKIDLQSAKWCAECQGCGKSIKGGLKYLGLRVNCNCGAKFVFPWWKIDPASIKGVPPGFLTSLIGENRL